MATATALATIRKLPEGYPAIPVDHAISAFLFSRAGASDPEVHPAIKTCLGRNKSLDG